MKAVVTGGMGFIGAHVVNALRNAGHNVLVFDTAHGADYEVDICDKAGVYAGLAKFSPDVVFHIAAIADARAVLENPERGVQVNIGGAASVFDASRMAKVKRVVLASTCWVANAMDDGFLTEKSPFKSDGGGHVYTTTKIASELLAHDFKKMYGQDFTILRYGIPYGPGMWPGLVLMNWLKQASEGKPLVIFGDGSNTRRFVHVSDLARAHVLALSERARNQVYNLEGMRSVSIKELAETFQRAWGDVKIERREEPTRIGELVYTRKLAGSHKAFIELGWEPTVDLEAGVRQTVAWYKNSVLAKAEAVGARD